MNTFAAAHNHSPFARFGLSKADRDASLERFALDLAPELRRLYPTAVWEDDREPALVP